MKPEIKEGIIEELERIYQEYRGMNEDQLRAIMPRKEELEIIFFNGIGPSLYALHNAGFQDDSLPVMIAKWLHDILLDELDPEWDKEDREELIRIDE